METINLSKKQFVIYMAVAFGLAWILEMIASIFSNNGNQMVFAVILMITMFMPFLGVLIARIPLKGMGWVPHLKGKLRYVFFALWMPALLSILGGVLFFVIFPDTFDSEFMTLRGLLEEAGALEQFEAKGITMPMYLLITSIQAVTVAPFMNMFVALGEEVGWRGALYPYLKKKLGVTKGRIVFGFGLSAGCQNRQAESQCRAYSNNSFYVFHFYASDMKLINLSVNLIILCLQGFYNT